MAYFDRAGWVQRLCGARGGVVQVLVDKVRQGGADRMRRADSTGL